MLRFFPGRTAQVLDTAKQVLRIACAGALMLLRRITAGVKQLQMNWTAESVHLLVMNKDLGYDQVKYSPASEQLYRSVEYERNMVVGISNLRRDRYAKTYIYLLCSAWALTNQRHDSCTASPKYLRSVAIHLNTSGGAASLEHLRITVRVYENQALNINGILNDHEFHGI
jgi:hypothetical protein